MSLSRIITRSKSIPENLLAFVSVSLFPDRVYLSENETPGYLSETPFIETLSEGREMVRAIRSDKEFGAELLKPPTRYVHRSFDSLFPRFRAATFALSFRSTGKYTVTETHSQARLIGRNGNYFDKLASAQRRSPRGADLFRSIDRQARVLTKR